LVIVTVLSALTEDLLISFANVINFTYESVHY
jgi:hypothetical protein